MIPCTKCKGEGFLNAELLPEFTFNLSREDVISYIKANDIEDVISVCDCCGDGKGWYGEPGYHYSNDDPAGPNGPYASNGGYCKCH